MLPDDQLNALYAYVSDRPMIEKSSFHISCMSMVSLQCGYGYDSSNVEVCRLSKNSVDTGVTFRLGL